MPITRDDAITIADRFVRSQGWTHWSTKRLSAREAQEGGRTCWRVQCHPECMEVPETSVWVAADDGSVLRALRVGRGGSQDLHFT